MTSSGSSAAKRRKRSSPRQARRLARERVKFAALVESWMVKAEGPGTRLTAVERRRILVDVTAVKSRNTSGRAGVIVGFAAVGAGILAVAQAAANAPASQQVTLMVVFLSLLIGSGVAFADAMGVGKTDATAAEIASAILDRRAAQAPAPPEPAAGPATRARRRITIATAAATVAAAAAAAWFVGTRRDSRG